MSLSKKNSRPISYNGLDFRYAVFLNSGWYDVTVQIAEGKGQKLASQFKIPITDQTSITPKDVVKAIQFAMKNGWLPNTNKEKPFKTRFESNRFMIVP